MDDLEKRAQQKEKDRLRAREYRRTHPNYDCHHAERNHKYYCKKNGIPYISRTLDTESLKMSYDNAPITKEKIPESHKRKPTIRKKTKIPRINLKIHILTFYGGGNTACVLCGMDNIDCLSIDHINGDGGKERKSGLYRKLTHDGHNQPGGQQFYKWLVKNGYPKGYRTLCMNCQWITLANRRREKQVLEIKQIKEPCFTDKGILPEYAYIEHTEELLLVNVTY